MKRTQSKDARVELSVLLSPSYRSVDRMAEAIDLLSKHGFVVMSTGKATLCCTLTASKFKELFGSDVPQLINTGSSDFDFGKPKGRELINDLAVPSELTHCIQAVSVEPPATRLADES